MPPRIARRLKIATLLAASFCANSALAADQTWLNAGPTNDWNTTDLNWDAGVAWTQGNNAIFGGALDAVNLTEAISAGGLTFNSSGFTVGGNILTLVGTPTISVTNSADSATITSAVAGSAGFTKSGPGTLIFGSTTNNTYTGQTIISTGTLRLNGLTNSNTVSGALGAGGLGNETIVQSGATLDLNGHQITNTEIVRIAGTGVGGNGAIINSGATASNLFNLNRLELSNNASIGVANRFDLRGGTTPTLDLAGFTLTKLGASQFSVVGATITSGNINVNAGTFSIESTSFAQGIGAITVNSGATLALYNTTGANLTRNVVLNNGGIISNLGVAATINSTITVNGATQFNGGTTTNTYAGSIIGSGSITYNAAQATSNGVNTYSGGTTIGQASRATIGNASGYGTGTVTVQGDGTVNDGQAFFGALSVANNFSLSGQGGNTADGSKRGALRLDGGTVTGNITLAGTGAAGAGIGAHNSTGTINGVISGAAAASFTVAGASTIVLTGTNTFAGNVIIGNNVGSAALTIGGSGTLGAGNYAGTISSANTAANTATFNYNSNTNQILSGIISNGTATALVLNKAGGSVLTLSGPNTYTGATTVNAGTLNLTGSLTSAITVNSGAILTGTGSTTGNITFAAGSGILASPTGSNAVQGATITTAATTNVFVSGTPSGALATVDVIRYTGTTPGTANFSAATNYRTGLYTDTGTKITLDYTAEAKSSTTGAVAWTTGASGPWNGGTDANFFWGDSVTFDGNTARAVTTTGTLAPSSVTVSNTASAITFAGAGSIAGAGSLVKSNGGELVFTMATANSYTGGTIINGGMITLGTGGTGTNTTSAASLGIGDVTINSGATLKLWIQNSNTHAIANNLNLNGGVLLGEDGIYNLNGGVALTGANNFRTKWSGKNLILNGEVSGTGSVTIDQAAGGNNGTVIFAGNNTYTGTTTISGVVGDEGILQIGNGGGTGRLGTGDVINNGALIVNRTGQLFVPNTISGTGSFTHSGASVTFMSGTNSYSGANVIGNGTVVVSNIGVTGANGNLGTNGTISMGATTTAGTLLYTGAGETTNRVLNWNGTTGGAFITNNGTGLLRFTANTTTTGSGAKGIIFGGSNDGQMDGSITGVGGILNMTKDGGGTWTFGGAIDLTGGGVTLNNGALTLAATGSITSNGTTNHTLNAGDFNINGSVTSTGASGATLIGAAGSIATLNINTGGSFTHNKTNTNGFGIGNGSGATAIVNINGGSLTMTADDTFIVGFVGGSNGIVNVNSGTLSLGSGGNFTLSQGSTAGNGTVNLNGGTLSTARNVVKLGTGTATFNFNGGTLQLQTGITAATFMTGLNTANVRNGGAVIDTNGNDATIGQALVHSTIGGDNALDGGLTKAGAGILTLSGANTYTGNTTVNGGTVAVTGTLNAANYAPAKIFVAAPDVSGNDNPIISLKVLATTSYTNGSTAGLGSTAVSNDAQVTNTALNTTATVLAGTASSDTNVTMQWRQRTTLEAAASNPNAVLSDVVNFNGTGSDVFLLQMSYADAALSNLGLNETAIALSGELRLGWYDTVNSVWTTANVGNSGGTNFFEGTISAATFLSNLGANPLSTKLGSYGVDPTTNTVWAVLNHNSEFAVIPEPSTLVLGGLALLGFAGAGLRRRRMTRA